MGEMKVEHVLLFLVGAFLVYHMMEGCRRVEGIYASINSGDCECKTSRPSNYMHNNSTIVCIDKNNNHRKKSLCASNNNKGRTVCERNDFCEWIQDNEACKWEGDCATTPKQCGFGYIQSGRSAPCSNKNIRLIECCHPPPAPGVCYWEGGCKSDNPQCPQGTIATGDKKSCGGNLKDIKCCYPPLPSSPSPTSTPSPSPSPSPPTPPPPTPAPPTPPPPPSPSLSPSPETINTCISEATTNPDSCNAANLCFDPLYKVCTNVGMEKYHGNDLNGAINECINSGSEGHKFQWCGVDQSPEA
jgi:hypothetical protein